MVLANGLLYSVMILEVLGDGAHLASLSLMTRYVVTQCIYTEYDRLSWPLGNQDETRVLWTERSAKEA